MVLVRSELVESTLLEVASMVLLQQLSNKIDISFRKRRKEDTFVAYLDLTVKP